MPKPAAAFSALMITNSSWSWRRRAGRWSARPSRPDLPTTSPKKAKRIISVLLDGDILAFRQDGVQSLVMSFDRQTVCLLAHITQPQHEHALSRPQRLQRPVVIAP